MLLEERNIKVKQNNIFSVHLGIVYLTEIENIFYWKYCR